MVQLLAGFQLSQALYAVARLGVADCLRDGPRDAAEVAAETGADGQALRRVLRSLASAGVFTQSDDGLFGLTPLGETLTKDSPRPCATWPSSSSSPTGTRRTWRR
jgi:Dimerisation domain